MDERTWVEQQQRLRALREIGSILGTLDGDEDAHEAVLEDELLDMAIEVVCEYARIQVQESGGRMDETEPRSHSEWLELALLAAMRDVDVWSQYPPGHPRAGEELLWHRLARLSGFA